MNVKTDRREQLRDWLLTNSKARPLEHIADDTNIIEERIITSIQTFDLVHFIERVRGSAIDLNKAKPGAFQTIDSICNAFFADCDGGEK